MPGGDGRLRNRVWLSGMLLCVAAGCVACGPVRGALPAAQASTPAPGSGSAGPRAGGTLTVAVSSDFPTLDPALAQDTESISAIQLMYEPLFSYAPGGLLVGRLARAWHWNAAGTALTVDLHASARFADGTPVTSADVAFSLDRMLAMTTDSPHALSFSALVGFSEIRAGKPWLATGVQPVSNDTIIFHLKHPVPYLPELLAMPSTSVVEERLVQGVAAGSAWWFEHSAGSGPYVLASSTPGQSLELRPSPKYWRKGIRTGGYLEGPFAAVDFRIVPSPAQQARMFAAGQLDMLSNVSPAQLADLAPPPAGSRLWEASDLGLAYLGFNVAKPPFDHVLMRRAVAYALNKRKLLAAAGGQGEVAGGMLPPGIPGYDPALAPYPYNPSEARALFREAGGKPGLPVQILTIAAGGTVQQATTDAVAESVARDLDAVGFQVTVLRDTWQEYYRDLASGRANLFQAQWLADYPDPQDFMFNLLDSAAIGAGNASFYHNPAFDRAEAAAAAMLDPTARAAAYRNLDDSVARALPILPEFYTESAVLVQPWVVPQSFAIFLSPPLMPQLDRVWLVPHTGG